MQRLIVFASAAVLVAGPAVAQGRREIPLPDTLGANFNIADTATKKGTLADYDALIGVWEFRFQSRADDGAFSPAFSGHWTFEKKPGGRLIESRWRRDDPSESIGSGTYTYRAFDSERGLWQMVGMRSTGGEFQLGLTWSDASNRYAIQREGQSLMRIRYFAIDTDHFLWRTDRSDDNGKSWLRDASTMEVKRIGR